MEAGDAAVLPDELSMRGVADQAVLRDEVTPLLRILFDASTAVAAKEEAEAQAAAEAAVAAAMAAAAAGASNFSLAATATPAAGKGAATTASAAAAAAAAAVGRKMASGPEQDAGRAALAMMSKCLNAIAAEQDQVIKDICMAEAPDIAGCVEALHTLNDGVSEVQGLLADSSTQLQAVGGPLQATGHTLAELLAVAGNVEAGLGAVRATAALLHQFLKVGELLEARQLDGALQLVLDLRDHQLGQLLSNVGSSSRPAGAAPSPAPSQKQAAAVSSLRAFFEGVLEALVAAVEAAAISELHAWLTSARDLARTIGLRAVRKVAVAKQLEHELTKERLRVTAQLRLGKTPIAELCASVATSSFRRAAAADLAPPPPPKARAGEAPVAVTGRSIINLTGTMPPAALAELHPGSPHVAVEELVARFAKQQRRKRGVSGAGRGPAGALVGPAHGPGTLLGLGSQLAAANDVTTPLLAGLNMRGLLNCLHIHKALGWVPRLRDYYLQQRRLQVEADLAAPHHPFLEHHQAYLAQVIGFFVVEASVCQTIPELLAARTADVLWEGTAAKVKVVLERALGTPSALLASGTGPTGRSGTPGRTPAPSSFGTAKPAAAQAQQAAQTVPPIMVLVKDFVLLACDALERADCQPTPLQDVLAAAGPTYHDLLLTAALAQASTVLAGDPVQAEHVIRSEEEAAKLCGELGLPIARDAPPAAPPPPPGGLPPPPPPHPPVPFRVPFTLCVPGLLRLLRGYVADSIAYLRGLVPPWELEAAAMLHRDAMVARLASDVLLPHIASFAAAGKVAEAMRLVSGAWALQRAGPALDAYLRDAALPEAERDLEVRQWVARGAEALAAADDLTAGRDVTGMAAGSASWHFGSMRRNNGNRGAEVQIGPSVSRVLGGSAAPPNLQSSLHLVLDSAERALLRQVSRRVETLLAQGFKSTPWQPTTHLDPGPSEHIPSLLQLLQEVFEDAFLALPRPSWAALVRTTLKSVALSYLKLFSPDSSVPGYNLLVIERLAFDISALQNFAARLTAQHSGGARAGGASAGAPPDAHPLVGLVQQFSEPAQLFQLLLSPEMEAVLVPETRRQRFPDLELSVVVLALDKYRELVKVGKDRTPFPTRKQVDALVRALRQQMTR